MIVKERKSERELIALLMAEVRKRPECEHVTGVAITRPVSSNWGAAWGATGNKITPAIAFEVERELRAQFDIS